MDTEASQVNQGRDFSEIPGNSLFGSFQGDFHRHHRSDRTGPDQTYQHVEFPAATDVVQEGVLLGHARFHGDQVAALLASEFAFLFDRLNDWHRGQRHDLLQTRLHYSLRAHVCA